MSELSLIKCSSYEQAEVDKAVREALDNLGGLAKFVRPGQKVILKVSLLTGAAPERAITTHPAIVRSVVREVQRVGGIAFIGDIPANTLVDVSEIFRITGLEAVARETGAHLTSLKKEGAHQTRLNNKSVPEVLLSSEVLEADVVINLPKLKTHAMMLFTGAVKNLYGVISGFNKSKYHFQAAHPRQFAQLLVDIYEVIRPKLTIMDAVVAMEGDGPANGTPRQVGAIIASPDGVAVDSVAAALIGYRPDEILTTRYAEKRKLGVAALNRIQIKGERLQALKVNNFKKTKSVYYILKFIPLPFFRLAKLLNYLIKVAPEIDPAICNRCGNCVRHCSAGAISANAAGIYQIDLRTCILCFCCSEVCPVQAVKIKRNWLARQLSSGGG